MLMAKTGLKVPHTESVASLLRRFRSQQHVGLRGLPGRASATSSKFDYARPNALSGRRSSSLRNFTWRAIVWLMCRSASGDTEAALATLDRDSGGRAARTGANAYVDWRSRAVCARSGARQGNLQRDAEEFPFDVEARLLLARHMIWHSRTRRQRPSSSACSNRNRRTTTLWSCLGETYLRLGEYELARQALDRTCNCNRAIRSGSRSSVSSNS